MIEVVFEVVVIASPLIHELQQMCNLRQRLKNSAEKLVDLLRGEFYWRFLPSYLSSFVYFSTPL